MVSLVHALVLLLSALALGQVIGRIPLAALGGVLIITAWRMNEWEAIRFFGQSRIKHALVGAVVTMIATVALDLTQAILIGITISALIYLRQSAASLGVTSERVRPEKLRETGIERAPACPHMHVFYLTGPIFFGSVSAMLEAFQRARSDGTIILSMRGVPLIDIMGAQSLKHIIEEQHARGGLVYLSGVQPHVREMLARTGLLDKLGEANIFWSADQAIVAAYAQHHSSGCPYCAVVDRIGQAANPWVTRRVLRETQ